MEPRRNMRYQASLALLVLGFIFVSCDSGLIVPELPTDDTPEPLSSEASILSFELLDPAVAGTIDEAQREVTVEVPAGTDVSDLVAHVEHSGVQVVPDPESPLDYTDVLTLAVHAEDGTVCEYTVRVVVLPDDAKQIVSFRFSFPYVSAAIYESELFIEAYLPYSIDLTALVPTIVHTGVSITPASGDPQDFSVPVEYEVTAADGSIATYLVAVHRELPNRDATLTGITLTDGVLRSEIQRDMYSYEAFVGPAVDSVTITATPTDNNATVAYLPSQSVPLAAGGNWIEILVTAEDGILTQLYELRIDRGGDLVSPLLGLMRYLPDGTYNRSAWSTALSRVSRFRMAPYEVTREQYVAVMGVDPSYVDRSQGMSDPVQGVSWYDAIAFCNLLSIQEGLEPVYRVSGVDFTAFDGASTPFTDRTAWNRPTVNWDADGYRLPTWSEWLWAAMGGDTDALDEVNTDGYSKPFAGSDGTNAVGDYAIFGYGSGIEGSTTFDGTFPVGSKLPNELGIFDLSGNVWEYLWDTSGTVPLDGLLVDYRGPKPDAFKTTAGGSWDYDVTSGGIDSRVAGVSAYSPYRNSFGIRVVRR